MTDTDIGWRNIEVFDEELLDRSWPAYGFAQPLCDPVDTVRVLIEQNVAKTRRHVTGYLQAAHGLAVRRFSEPDAGAADQLRQCLRCLIGRGEHSIREGPANHQISSDARDARAHDIVHQARDIRRCQDRVPARKKNEIAIECVSLRVDRAVAVECRFKMIFWPEFCEGGERRRHFNY